MKFISAMVALCALATPLHAQGFEASRLTLEFYSASEEGDVETSYATALGDTSYLFLPQVGLQLGIAGSAQLSASQEFLEEDTAYAFSAHGFYDVMPDLRLGLLLGVDTYDDGSFLTAIEGIYLTGPTRVEGRLGSYTSDEDPATLIEASSSYLVTNELDIRGAYQRLNYEEGTGHFSLASIGAGYRVTDTVTGYGSIGAITNDFGGGESYSGTQLTVGVNIAIGSRPTPMMFTFNPFF